jgi:hypothetical protein
MNLVEAAIESCKNCTETEKLFSDLIIEFYKVHSDIINLIPFESIDGAEREIAVKKWS